MARQSRIAGQTHQRDSLERGRPCLHGSRPREQEVQRRFDAGVVHAAVRQDRHAGTGESHARSGEESEEVLPRHALGRVRQSELQERGHWRGPAWLNTSYMALKGLKRYGYNETAQACREQLLAWCDQNRDHLWEYYDSKSGKGTGARNTAGPPRSSSSSSPVGIPTTIREKATSFIPKECQPLAQGRVERPGVPRHRPRRPRRGRSDWLRPLQGRHRTSFIRSGDVASLNPRLIARTPPGSSIQTIHSPTLRTLPRPSDGRGVGGEGRDFSLLGSPRLPLSPSPPLPALRRGAAG